MHAAVRSSMPPDRGDAGGGGEVDYRSEQRAAAAVLELVGRVITSRIAFEEVYERCGP